MCLFENIQRNYYGAMQRLESYYTYLNRSAKPESQRIRDILEQWFSEYPQDEIFEFRRRFENNGVVKFSLVPKLV